jgi:succinate dehydrogenase / fumarate reductase cytochrome b subunit
LSSTIGKKAIMAVTGVILVGFVIVHMLGNLQVFLGPEAINRYAEFLKAEPPILWGARSVLLASVILHIWSAFSLWRLKNEARPVSYAKAPKAQVSGYAARTMYWSGPILGAFVVYHLLHFTVGVGGTPFDPKDVYSNVVRGFSYPIVSLFYIVAMAMLCTHLYHGVWSMFQTLGLNHPVWTPRLQTLAKVVAFALFIGFTSVPVAVMAGIVRLQS